MQKSHIVLVHIMVWLIYFLGKGYYIDTYWYNDADGNPFYWRVWFGSRFHDLISAYITTWSLNRFILREKYFAFVFFTVAHLVFHIAYNSWCWNWFSLDYFFFGDDGQFMELIVTSIEIKLLGVIFFVASNWTSGYYKKRKLEDEVTQTELKFLKSQMSPHFLFNVFNNIYSLSLDENPKTPKAIGQLKSIMSYVKVFENKAEISLKEEGRSLQDYIELNKLRFKVKVNFDSYYEDENLKIEPMIFLPFFENAFKHGRTGEDYEIKSQMKEKDGVVYFEIINDIDPEKRKDDVSGVGLENIRKRLPFLYSDFELDVFQEGEKYNVKMRLGLETKVKL